MSGLTSTGSTLARAAPRFAVSRESLASATRASTSAIAAAFLLATVRTRCSSRVFAATRAVWYLTASRAYSRCAPSARSNVAVIACSVGSARAPAAVSTDRDGLAPSSLKRETPSARAR
ncbi:MAG: hypothetical protein E6J91_37555 [Deltaproteobacteria bacterium]|nr:MAG: hypothetical protein E6J91_37555 [Deltaproteobacteria bacterium]